MDIKRLILFVIFSFSSIMLWDAWQKHAIRNQPILPQTEINDISLPKPSDGLINRDVSNTLSLNTDNSDQINKLKTVTVKTDLFIADISTKGGEILRVELLKHRATSDKTKNFILFDALNKYSVQTGLIGNELPNHNTIYDLKPGPLELGTTDSFDLRFEATTKSGLIVNKILSFNRGSYSIEISHEIVNPTENEISPYVYYQFQRSSVAPEGESSMIHTFTGPAVFTEEEKYQRISFDDISDGSAKYVTKSTNGWLAMVQHYFVAVWLPSDKLVREYYMKKVDTDLYTAGIIIPTKSISPGSQDKVNIPLYVGPQEQSKLKSLAPGLDLVVDYGWLHPIAAPIFWMLELIFSVIGNWGWAIVILTVFIKLVFYPLSAASYKSMAKMRLVTPRLMTLKERYGDDRQKLNQEMMKLYQTEKINPLGGCLPIVIQIPVFISLYWVLLGGAEMRGAEWILWIKDLSAQDPYFVLPIIMVISMVVQTKLNPTPPDPIQAKVMMAMPFVFGVMFFWFPAGLVLYWVVNNVLSILQQWMITRTIERGASK